MSDFKIEVGVELNTGDLKTQLESAAKGVKVEVNADTSNLTKQIATATTSATKGAGKLKIDADVSAAYKQIRSINQEVNKLEVNRIKLNVDSHEFAEVSNRIGVLRKESSDLMSQWQGKMSSGMLSQLAIDADKAQAKMAQTKSKAADLKAELAKNIKLNLGDSGVNSYVTQMSGLSTQIKKVGKEVPTLVKNFKQLEVAYQNMAVASRTGTNDDLIAAQKKYNEQLQRTKNMLKEVQSSRSAENAASKLSQQKSTFSLQIDRWLKDNSAAAGQFEGRLREIQSQIQRVDATGLSRLQSEFKQTTMEAQIAGKATMTVGDKLKQQASKYAAYFGVATVAMEAVQMIREMFQNVLDVDTAMTGLRRVTELTAQGYEDMYGRMAASAKEYGQVLTDTINATSDWVRAGFDADTALGLAEKTAMYQNVSDLDYDTAAENLLTSYNGFKENFVKEFAGDDVAAVGHIVDVLNELDNKFSVTSAGLGEGLSRSASALMLAGNTFEESAAMIGAITEVTQDPEKAGSAMKVLSLRLRGMKGELIEMGEETDENVENLSRMQGQILKMTGGKVNIFDDNGDFRSTYDIMMDIAAIYDDLSSTDQADLLETIAGKHRANDVAALLQNSENAIRMEEAAMNSAGSAAEENAKRVESLQGRINQLTTSFQTLSNSAMDSGFLKGAVSGVTAFIDVLGKLIDTFGLLPTIATAASAALSFKGFGAFSFDKEARSIKLFGNTFKETFSMIGAFKSGSTDGFANMFGKQWNSIRGDLGKDISAINKFKEAVNGGMTKSGAFDAYMSKTSNAAKEFAMGLDEATIKSRQMTSEIQKFSAQQKTAAVATLASQKGLKSAASLMAEYNTGCKQTKMGQQEFISAVSQGNAGLGKYLSGLNGARAGMGGYVVSLIGAKVATIGLQVATMALNAALTMGIGILVSGIINGIMSFINRADELADKIDEVTTSYREQHQALTEGKSNFGELAKSYSELSKGVDKLTGKNISLMPDEYEEYQSVVNEIASTIPSLVAGYDAQGNAILNCASDVDTLTEAYENLIIAENNKLLNGDGEDYHGLGEVLTDFQNDYNKLQDKGWFDEKNTIDTANALEGLLGLPTIDDASVGKYIRDLTKGSDDIKTGWSNIGKTLKAEMSNQNLGFDDMEAPDDILGTTTQWSAYITRVLQEYPEVARTAIEGMNSQLDAIAQESHDGMMAFMENAFLQDEYSNMDEKMQSFANSIVNGLDGEFIHSIIGNKTGDEAKQALNQWVDDLLGTLDGLDAEVQDKLTSSFDLQDKFANGDMSLGEYKKQLEDVASTIDGLDLDEEIKTQLKVELNTDGVNNEWDAFVNRLEEHGMEREVAIEFANGLSASEWAAAQELVIEGDIDWKNKTPDEIKAEIQSLAKYNEALNFEIDIEAETETLDAFNTALSESKSASGLAQESITALQNRYEELSSYDAASLFDETSTGIRLNASELNKLESEYAKFKKSQITNEDGTGSLDVLKNKYDELGTQIAECSDINKRADLYTEQEDIRSKINELAELATAYDGLTNAYAEWQNAESAGQDRDMYETAFGAMEEIEDEMSRGWVDDATREYVELFTGKDLSTAGIEEIQKAWAGVGETIEGTTYSIKDFYTVNEDGDVTADGIFNFFDAVKQKQEELGKDWIQTDADGNMTSFNFGVNGDKAIAEAMGISEELVQIMIRASEDAGFVVSMDGTYSQLADLQSKAQESANTLKEMGKTDIDFDFGTNNVESLKSQLIEAKKILDEFKNDDGTIKLKDDGSYVDGAQEAIDVYSTLTSMVDKLTEPKYMQLETNQVEESLQETLSDMQRFEDLVKKKHQLEITGADTSEIDAEMDSIAQKLSKLGEETKIELGIDGLSPEEIKEKLEAGEIEIPATVDIQMEMSEDLKDLKTILLGQIEGLSREEIEAQLNVDVEAGEVNNNLDEGVEAALEGEEGSLEGVTWRVDAAVESEGGVDTSMLEGTVEDSLNQVVPKGVVIRVGDVSIESDGVRTLQQLLDGLETKKQVSVNADVSGEEALEHLESSLGGLTDTQVKAIAQVLGQINVDGLKHAMDSLGDEHVKAIAEAMGQGDIDGLRTAIQNIPDQKVAQAIAQALGFSDVQSLDSAIAGLDGKQVQAIAQALGITDVDSLRGAVNSLDGKTVQAVAEAIGSGAVSSLQSAINNLTGKTVNVVANLIGNAASFLTGGGGVDGTAHVNGTAFAGGTTGKAFAQGDWGTKQSGVALGAELGTELLVRDGRWYTIGENGAEFFGYKKGDIIE